MVLVVVAVAVAVLVVVAVVESLLLELLQRYVIAILEDLSSYLLAC